MIQNLWKHILPSSNGDERVNKILIAEDDRNIRAGLADTLELEGYEPVEAADGNAALAEYKNMRKNALNTYFASSVNNVAEVCAQIDAAQSCAEVTEIFFDATAGKTAANY